MTPAVTIRVGRVDEKADLEALQMRASLKWEEHRKALLSHPEAVEVPLHELQSGHVLVATGCGELKGFAAMALRGDGEAELNGLFVEPSRWGEGIGRDLVIAVENLAKNVGSRKLFVIANPNAEGFYAQCGFLLTGATKHNSATPSSWRRRSPEPSAFKPAAHAQTRSAFDPLRTLANVRFRPVAGIAPTV